jgi:tetratricopeptide (TPR) repeat protein
MRLQWKSAAHWPAALMAAMAAAVLVASAFYLASEPPRTGDGVATYTPASADEVVEHLQRHSVASKGDLRARLAVSASLTKDPVLAVNLARRHYDRARSEGDPREMGLAQSALGHWWDQTDAPVQVLLMKAAIRQYQHDFEGALQDLGKAISAEPANIQAWLSQAAIQQTVGSLDDAARSCSRLVALSNHVAAHVCLADLASLKGDRSALDKISRLSGSRSASGEMGWILTVLAEMAERLGRPADADKLFKSAIAADAGSYQRVAYADFLMLQGRAGEVETVLQASPSTDAVSLRRAIALKRTGDPRVAAEVAILRQRFEASMSRGDSLHLRELARFALDIDGNPGAALALAKRNWTVQKEPADALLLAKAAVAAGTPQDADPVRVFVRDPGMFDVRLDALL